MSAKVAEWLSPEHRARGSVVGAAIGDALAMPLEFGPRRDLDRRVREMQSGRQPAGTFTDDTEMALALAESLLAHRPLYPGDLAQRFVVWFRAGPDEVGIHTRHILSRIAGGQPWEEAVDAVQRQNPDSTGYGSVMRCWPVALAHWDDLDQLLADSRLQSRVTHPHPECKAGSASVNATIHCLLHGASREDAIAQALAAVDMPTPLRAVIEQAPTRRLEELRNSGWMRHTLESAVWGLLTSDTFEDAVVQVVNLGNDADTARRDSLESQRPERHGRSADGATDRSAGQPARMPAADLVRDDGPGKRRGGDTLTRRARKGKRPMPPSRRTGMNLLYTCSWCKRRLRKGEPCYGMGARLRRDVALPAQDGPFLHLDLRTQPGKTVHCAIATEDSEAKKAGWDVVLMACCPECAESLKHTLQKEAYLGEIFGLPGPAQG